MNFTDLTDGQFRQAVQEFKQESDRRHLENRDRMDAIEKQVEEFGKNLAANTATTNAIKRDTEQIVTLFRASQLGATIVKWCATVGGGAVVAYAAFKGLTGH